MRPTVEPRPVCRDCGEGGTVLTPLGVLCDTHGAARYAAALQRGEPGLPLVSLRGGNAEDQRRISHPGG